MVAQWQSAAGGSERRVLLANMGMLLRFTNRLIKEHSESVRELLASADDSRSWRDSSTNQDSRVKMREAAGIQTPNHLSANERNWAEIRHRVCTIL